MEFLYVSEPKITPRLFRAHNKGQNIPRVSISIYGGEGNAAVDNLQQWLESEHERALGSGWDGLVKTNDGIVVDDISRLDCCRGGSSDDSVGRQGESEED